MADSMGETRGPAMSIPISKRFVRAAAQLADNELARRMAYRGCSTKFRGVSFSKIPIRISVRGVGVGSYSAGPVDVFHMSRDAPIEIGSYTSIGRGLKLISVSGHHPDHVSVALINSLDPGASLAARASNTFCLGGITIGSDVWIGDDVTIMGGCNIGDGAIVGTRSLVTSSVDTYSIVGGVPARKIRLRFPPAVCNDLEGMKWWSLPAEEVKQLAPRLKQEASVETVLRLKEEIERLRASRT